MAVRRQYRDSGGVIVAEERAEAAAHADADAAESEVVSSYVGPAEMAQAWVRWTQALIAFGLLVVETLLTFRLAFALTGANPGNGFVDFIYDITGPLVSPFEGIASEQVSGDRVFEPETVVAMTVYGAAALLVIAFMALLSSTPGPHTDVVKRERHAHYDGHA
jgi:hypothetical protein